MYGFKEQDTTWLQLESVIRCADALGYKFNGRSFYTTYYIDDIKKTFFLSFDDMQKIHNDGEFYLFSRQIAPVNKGMLKMLSLTLPDPCKIVQHTTLQYNKKLKKFTTQQNMVKFV